jgi:hypothetical protein
MVPDLTGYTVLEATILALALNGWKIRDGEKVIEDPCDYVVKEHTGAKPGDCLGMGEVLGVILDPIDRGVRRPFLLGALGGLVGGLAAALVLWFIKAFGG